MSPQDVIPEGKYCYKFVRVSDKYRLLQMKPCEYWDVDENKDKYSNGICKLKGVADWELDKPVLWDRIKICGIKTEKYQ